MISYKTLIVLTVIFDITCGLRYWKECRGILRKFGFRPGFPLYNMNFLLQFDDETEYIKYMNKMIKLDCDTNMTLPKKVVFTTLETQADLTSISSDDKKIDSPEDKNIDILEDNKEKLPEHFSYLLEFYSEAAKENNDDLEEVIRTPLEYCTLSIKELELEHLVEEIKMSKKLFKFASDMRKIVQVRDYYTFTADEDSSTEADEENAENPDGENPESEENEEISEEKKKISEEKKKISEEKKKISEEKKKIFEEKKKISEEKTKKLIKDCEDSILNYKFESAGVVYTYDEKNKYRNFLTSSELVLSVEYIEDQKYVHSTMSEAVKDYFFYHGTLAVSHISESFNKFTIVEMCNSYFPEENREKIEASKNREQKEEKKEEMEEKKQINEKDNVLSIGVLFQ